MSKRISLKLTDKKLLTIMLIRSNNVAFVDNVKRLCVSVDLLTIKFN